MTEAVGVSPGRDPQALLQAAWTASRAGQAAQAVGLCDSLLRAVPDHPDGLLLRAMLHHQAGEAPQAARAIERALAARPNFPYAHFVAGLHHLDGNRPAAAVPAFQRVLALDANFAPAWATLAAALRQTGKAAAALDAATRAIAAMPNDPAAHFIRVDALADLGRLAEARELAQALVTRAPSDPRGWRSLGNVLERAADTAGALAAVERWRTLETGSPAADAALARLYDATGRHGDALALLEAAVARAPHSAELHAALGGVALSAAARAGADDAGLGGHLEAAVGHLERAHALSPDDRAVLTRLGNALELLGRHDVAAERYARALALDPERPDSLIDVGRARLMLGDAAAALPYFERALAHDPGRPEVLNELGLAALMLGHVGRAVDSFEAAFAQSRGVGSLSNLLLALHYADGVSSAALLGQHRRYGAAVAGPPPMPHVNRRDPERPLRVGYVSADFGVHPVGFFVLPVLAAHDRDRVVVHCYSGRLVEDAVTARIRAHAQVWRAVGDKDDAALEAQIRADQIDLLVDLAGHTAGNRLAVFARKPAPVQATWLGYPATTGVAAIDYRLTDAVADPSDADAQGVEMLIRLPHGFHCYVPAEAAPAVAPLPARSDGAVTFGSFNNLSKISDTTIAAWARVLGAVPGSRLLVKARMLGDPDTRARYQAAFERAGVAAERLNLIAPCEAWHDHMALYGQVDIALDTIPYNGTTTTCDALWMGVPVVTLCGDRHAGRVGASLLAQLGLRELIAETLDDYVATAAALARDLDRLGSLRTTLRPRFERAPIGDPVRFTRALEAAYRDMWRRWCGTA